MLKRVLRNWLLNDRNEKCYDEPVKCGASTNRINGPGEVQAEPTLHFRVYKAVGGHIVEFQRYDTRTDRRDTTLYTINDEQNFGEAIAKISGMEILKN